MGMRRERGANKTKKEEGAEVPFVWGARLIYRPSFLYLSFMYLYTVYSLQSTVFSLHSLHSLQSCVSFSRPLITRQDKVTTIIAWSGWWGGGGRCISLPSIFPFSLISSSPGESVVPIPNTWFSVSWYVLSLQVVPELDFLFSVWCEMRTLSSPPSHRGRVGMKVWGWLFIPIVFPSRSFWDTRRIVPFLPFFES